MAKKRVDKRGTRKPITKIKFLVEGITEKFYFKELLKFKEKKIFSKDLWIKELNLR